MNLSEKNCPSVIYFRYDEHKNKETNWTSVFRLGWECNTWSQWFQKKENRMSSKKKRNEAKSAKMLEKIKRTYLTSIWQPKNSEGRKKATFKVPKIFVMTLVHFDLCFERHGKFIISCKLGKVRTVHTLGKSKEE